MRANGAVVTIHGYIGPDPITIDRAIFINDIFHPGGFKIPCTIVAPAYAATGATLDESALYENARNQWMRKNKNDLWLSLLDDCSPDYNTDPTAAVMELGQG